MKTAALIGVLGVLGLFASGQPVRAGDDTVNDVAAISVTDAQQRVTEESNAIILDVRTPAEYEMSHIPDALNVSVQADDFDRMLADLDTEQTYIVHCTKNPADGRSSRALARMQELGFRHLFSLEGGYVAWKDSDLPLVEADDANQ